MQSAVLAGREWKRDAQVAAEAILEQAIGSRWDVLIDREFAGSQRVMLSSGGPVALAPFPNQFQHPLGPPTISGTTITVDMMLQQPVRITRMIMDLSLQRFFVDRVFASAGGVTGGAVIYDIVAANDLYADRDVQRVEPGAQFPEITTSRRAPGVATVEKWGGKVRIKDEARDRNNSAMFTNSLRQLTNTIIRKINQRGVEVLDAAVTANSRTATGHNWQTVVTAGASASSAALWPAADFAAAAKLADTEELGIVYNLWIMNPQEYFQLALLYGQYLNDVLASAGISIFVTNRVAAGTAYVVAEGQVGEMRVEKPLGTETWRDPEIETSWVQASVRPLMFVDNPFAVEKYTGLAG